MHFVHVTFYTTLCYYLPCNSNLTFHFVFEEKNRQIMNKINKPTKEERYLKNSCHVIMCTSAASEVLI